MNRIIELEKKDDDGKKVARTLFENSLHPIVASVHGVLRWASRHNGAGNLNEISIDTRILAHNSNYFYQR